ncbi:MarR family winged helix-turn-helix transcriptional regulator [Novosphingobium terrae]|uniref:MarR family winged helix-turn-helix transcriptional regulator n=1 Tax=Novosphingobium terrae TaxID=2726189 RepID=UPI00197CF91C|nr:MarR family winged helix-turn-helix transcriptional regulator [Novosphingobium terrae]
MTTIFDTITEPIARRVTAGLVRIGHVLRSRAWKGATPEGVTPTQGHALGLLREAEGGLSLGAIASMLGISAPTASDAMSALATKGLVVKAPGAKPRSINLSLTSEGEALAARTSEWPAFLSDAVETLEPAEQAALLRALVKLIRAMQASGDIPVQKMCVTCRYFRPNAHPGTETPHHCALVDAPFGDRHLRLHCGEHVPAEDDALYEQWR